MKKDKKEQNEKLKLVFMIITLIILIGLIILMVFMNKKNTDDKKMAYNEIITQINEQKIEKIKMTNGSNSINIVLKGEGEEKDRTKTALIPIPASKTCFSKCKI